MGIVVAERKFFGEIGSLDGGMKIYGGENVELGIRVRILDGHRVICNVPCCFSPLVWSEGLKLHIRFLQVWLCGGSIEVIPCSKIAHIERAQKPYVSDLWSMVRRNALRVAEVWMDEYKYNVNLAWNIPLKVKHPNIHLWIQNNATEVKLPML